MDCETRNRRWPAGAIGGCAVVAAGVLVYANSLSGPFIFDDRGSITDNPHVRRLWPIWEAMSAPPQETVAGRPVVALSLAVNHAIGGLDVRGYHALNLAIHLLCSLLLFGVVRRALCGPLLRDRCASSASPLAAAVAVIWTVHPLLTESVTYVIQRTGLIMALFYLLTLYCAIRGQSSARRWPWLAAAVVACGLGMGSKEVMVSAPLAVLVYDRVFVSGSFRRALRRRRWLYLGLALTWIILVALVLPGPRSRTAGFTLDIGASDYLRTQAGVILRYLRLALWPDPLVISYYDWPITRSVAESMPAGLMILALLAGTVGALARGHGLGFVGACFFLVLAPTSSFVPITTEVAAERRMYLSLAAVVAAAVIGCHTVMTYLSRRLLLTPRGRRAIEAGLAVAVAVLLGHGTVQRNRDYRTAVAIWRDATIKRPDNPLAHTNLGIALQERGKLDEAVRHYERAVLLAPTQSIPLSRLGTALAKQGRLDEAVARYEAALRGDPNCAEAHNNLGAALTSMGRPDEAITHCRKALRIDPRSSDAHYNLGNALTAAGRAAKAIEAYHHALRVNPDFAKAHDVLATALAARGNSGEAVAHYRRALQINPRFADAHVNLGVELLRQGRPDRAIAEYRAALRIGPDHEAAHYNLGNALSAQGEIDGAIREYRLALRSNPRYVEARINLGNTLREQGNAKAAIDQYREAIRTSPGNVAAHCNLAGTLASQGRDREALEVIREALEIEPEHAAARRIFDALQKRQG